ncbi:hypothetical protein ACHAWF_010835 [Thalassiosira exigua]
MALLTNTKVEEQVLTGARARAKAMTYGRDPLISSLLTVYSAVHPRKLFISGLPKLWSDLEVDLRRAELERETRSGGGRIAGLLL